MTGRRAFALSFLLTAAALALIYLLVVLIAPDAEAAETVDGWRPIADPPPCGQRVILWYFDAPIMGWRYCDIGEGGEPWSTWLEPGWDRAIFETHGITHWRPLTVEESEGPK